MRNEPCQEKQLQVGGKSPIYWKAGYGWEVCYDSDSASQQIALLCWSYGIGPLQTEFVHRSRRLVCRWEGNVKQVLSISIGKSLPPCCLADWPFCSIGLYVRIISIHPCLSIICVLTLPFEAHHLNCRRRCSASPSGIPSSPVTWSTASVWRSLRLLSVNIL